MKTVIYLDVLLLTNFLIGYALLAAAGLLAGMQARFGRMVLASLLAASSALILLAPELTYLQQLVYKVGTAAVITAAAFGVRPLRRYAAALGWFAALNLLLAGLCILVILRTGSPLVQTGNLAVYLRISPVLLVLLAGVCSAVVWLGLCLFARPSAPARTAGLRVDLGGVPVQLRAVLDTGCHLKDPITCLPVLLVSYPAARSRLPQAVCQYLDGWFAGVRTAGPPPGLSLRMIPCATATGQTVLPGFTVGRLELIGADGPLPLRRTAVAFTAQAFGSNRYEALYGADFL